MVLAEIVNDAVKKVKENNIFNTDEFKHYEYGQLTETEEFSAFKILFDGYVKNGDREKFYGKYHAQIPLKSTSFFRGLSRNAATLLAIKVADSMLAHCKRTVPLKCKLTVLTRYSILDPRSFRESSFEAWVSRFENQVSRIEFRVSRHLKNFSRISNRDFEETI